MGGGGASREQAAVVPSKTEHTQKGPPAGLREECGVGHCVGLFHWKEPLAGKVSCLLWFVCL